MDQEEKDTTEETPEERPAEPPAAAPEPQAQPEAPDASQAGPTAAAESGEPAPAEQPAATEDEPQRPARPAGERREGDGQRTERRPERPRRRFGRRKVCAFCVEKATSIDYKDAAKLRRYLSDRGRMESRRKTGTCAKHQRWLATALKRARHLALLPYTPEHIRTSGTFPTRR